jgi:hypothetical protein
MGSIPKLEDACMCWFSAEQASHITEAKAGQRLGIKRMNWHANWVVRDTEIETPRPTAVCMIDRTKVLFRFSEDEQKSLHLGPETEGTFRMLNRPKRDVFEFADGRQIPLNELPAGVIFDVLMVPGTERLSAVLETEGAVEHEHEEEKAKEPLLARLLAHF